MGLNYVSMEQSRTFQSTLVSDIKIHRIVYLTLGGKGIGESSQRFYYVTS